jgi:hypothetical protein
MTPRSRRLLTYAYAAVSAAVWVVLVRTNPGNVPILVLAVVNLPALGWLAARGPASEEDQ